MKFFSRKALVAGATAIAVSFAGVNVASAQSSLPSSSTTTAPAAPAAPAGDDDNTDGEGGTSTTPTKPAESGSSDLSAENIKAWIGIITAVVGALSAIYSFVNKISK
ncbi:hypothetical protein [Corynebacterium flavescens]|uniref:hypothetical protein n=1 Tax=Corynebacterium flavescens TaxID=28028 RepID=UPI000ED9C5BC|nr:hypothetical protein [Corynebacterium flavescens]